MPRLLNVIMKDGSRHFTSLPQTRLWQEVRDHVPLLPGARVTAFICDNVTEAWIDFTWGGQSFTINDQMGEYWFFANDPACPDSLLKDVASHFAKLLKRWPV